MNLFKLFGEIAINSSVADQTIDATMLKVDGLKTSLENAEGQANSTGKGLGSGGKLNAGMVALGNTISTVTNKVGSWVTTGLKNASKLGFGFSASMEAYTGQFEALLGDADKARQLVADLQTLAKVSPLGMEGLANNAVSLLNTGTALADIVPTLETLGNLSLGDSNKMDSVVRAYTQILSKGQLMAQEMYQLGDAGVPIREIMTLYGGERYADGSWYQAKMSDPKYTIPAEDMAKAFQTATSEGGKWQDYMFKMMDTWNGQVDRMGEEGKETLGAFFQPFFDMAKEEVLPKLVESLGQFRTWVDENKDDIEAFANTVGVVLKGGFDLLLETVKLLTEAIGVLSEAWNTLKTTMTNITASITVQTKTQASAVTSVGSTVSKATGSDFWGNLAQLTVQNSTINPDAPWIPGFATGLNYVPRDNFLARLHEGEAVLTKQEAGEWRNGGDVASAVRDAMSGIQFNVMLDSGILVGQLAPKMDEKLGILGNRKRRGN